MAKLYEKLQKALSSYQDRPVSIITKQTFTESLYIIRGKDQGSPAWHYILVPVSKIPNLKAQQPGATIDVTKFGRVITYRNHQDQEITASGWGRDPPKMFETWIGEQYQPASVDENVNLIYEQDDIRLCTMQRAVPEQKLGVHFHHHKQIRFHYIKVTEDLEMSLARRAGIKNYDRIISFNGINIENNTFDQFMNRFDSERHLPVQMLVCSPATYEHYKFSKKRIHSDLPTVQHLKPVYATSASNSNTDTPMISVDENNFCAVQWEDDSNITVVPQRSIFKSPSFTHVNDVCFIDVKRRYRKGKILFIGSYDDCKKLNPQSHSMMTTNFFNTLTKLFVGKRQNVWSTNTRDRLDCTETKFLSSVSTDSILTSETSSQQSLNRNIIPNQVLAQKENETVNMQEIPKYVHNTLEQFPNELLFYIFTYVDISNLYNAFWGLNSRFNSLFHSHRHLSLTFDNTTDLLLMKSYASYVNHLIVDTSHFCDLTLFCNLHSLILCDSNSKHLQEIQPHILPNLTYLSFMLGSKFIPSPSLLQNIFSNKFPSLHHVNLGRIDDLDITSSSSISPSLRFISLRSNNPLVIESILRTCPNLDHLQIHITNTNRNQNNNCSTKCFNHSLRRLTLWSDTVELSLDDIDIYLNYTSNVEYLYLQTECSMLFIHLANYIINRLHRLYQFNGHIKELIGKNNRIDNLESIYKMHGCFDGIKCIKETDEFRIFASE